MTVPIRILTATAIFDGHDASINIIRRVLQDNGAEIIHLGHNHCVEDLVHAAIQEDANAIAISSYQGGHLEYFKFLIDHLKQETTNSNSKTPILVFGGGGGTISTEEAVLLEQYGVEKIYTVDDGVKLGLAGMAQDLIQRCKNIRVQSVNFKLDSVNRGHSKLDNYNLAKQLSVIEQQADSSSLNCVDNNVTAIINNKKNIIGITGTGGSGKSTFIDELLTALLLLPQKLNIAYLAIDPTRKKSGGALLGDRLRINCQSNQRLFMRSIATRTDHIAISPVLKSMLQLLSSQQFDLILVETAGIGQSDTSIVELVDSAYYVMTRDYGAPSQLEKIEMLDFADKIILNKCDQVGSEDAYNDICVQWRRNHKKIDAHETCPVYPIIANNFNDSGTRDCVNNIIYDLGYGDEPETQKVIWQDNLSSIIPNSRNNYLLEIAVAAKKLTEHNQQQITAVHKLEALHLSLNEVAQTTTVLYQKITNEPLSVLEKKYNVTLKLIDNNSISLLQQWSAKDFSQDNNQDNKKYKESLSHLHIPLIATPKFYSQSDTLEFLLNENFSGHFPFTAGVFPYRSVVEEPARMFAGEGVPEDTNHRFFYLIKDQQSIRLSTAFDPITLYGRDPDLKPDNFGCIGMSGVSIACFDDMKKLYSGINLADKNTSVSLTINGPAAILLAWFFNTAIDQQIEIHLKDTGLWQQAETTIKQFFSNKQQPQYHGELPDNHDGLGLATLGISGKLLVDDETYQKIKINTLKNIRGTLQADIIKEELAQNECIFSLPFGLSLMSDIQQYFINEKITKFYSVSISGYHIAEAGANPITQLAFTLANGFTFVEYYLSKGMKIDDFTRQFSFFFSNGMDPEYAVIGRVARRIWARAMRYRYNASPRSQKLKYHIQTSGRSLHMQEIELNDVRTTLQALYAINDNCNSLHTNAYDEAVTTPTEESVHRALAIQMIINQELGLNINQNPLQGSFIIKELTELVEQQVYQEFERLSDRGGVIGALETFYQRNKIQQESLYYETQKSDGRIPLVGVNTFVSDKSKNATNKTTIIHCSDTKKQQQIDSLNIFLKNNKTESKEAINTLIESIELSNNSFECLMDVSRFCSLAQITDALFIVGGQYRRKM